MWANGSSFEVFPADSRPAPCIVSILWSVSEIRAEVVYGIPMLPFIGESRINRNRTIRILDIIWAIEFKYILIFNHIFWHVAIPNSITGHSGTVLSFVCCLPGYSTSTKSSRNRSTIHRNRESRAPPENHGTVHFPHRNTVNVGDYHEQLDKK